MERSLKILLVEDDQNFGDVLKSYLEMHDYEVSLATDGVAGWDKFRKNKYDLCILDVMMPKKDGFTLGKEIREKDGDLPIIYLTAKTMKEDILQGFKMGADDYITKPFNSEELLYRIQAILKSLPLVNITLIIRCVFSLTTTPFLMEKKVLLNSHPRRHTCLHYFAKGSIMYFRGLKH
jgi:DNA-binding response OmpR family regulator